MKEINQSFPAACYIPIFSKGCRNFMVLNIVEEETRLFVTAEKAPYLICLEVFQPLEIELQIKQEINSVRPRALEIIKQMTPSQD